MDRRHFLRASLGGAALAAASAAPARENKPIPPEALGLLYDGTQCVGCQACAAACKRENGMPPEFGASDEQLWDTPLDISAKTLTVIKLYKDGAATTKDVETDGYAFVKKSCLHCADASCVSACPVSAMKKDPVTGIVEYDAGACVGCRYCVAACPFGVPRFEYDKALPKIVKCELCRHRGEGKYAACAEVCPTGATLFGKVSDLKAEAARRRALEPGAPTTMPRGRLGDGDVIPAVAGRYVDRLYGETELGGTQVMLLSGVSFDKLGYPDLPERSFASKSEAVQHALYGGLIAPIAVLGVLAAVAKRNVKPEGDEQGDPDERA